ncbi:theronine dehydrogenase [Arthrobacter sp. RIT-PI-e]|uniref:L-idonate 5-dehydrogenase n=1 Tax=Arthrobacter sp. RIT-PI-e TaxID=1681197 RepID=UPI00067637C5|nr:L-idonate 5-dehydrogenase [Arthrobacter sp. RIT-PI-e]KNC20138.1 theronine dehydrogenase [Arthrobacter sp. RIT-PI-e]
MRAVVVHGPDDLRVDTLPEPQAGEGEVVIDVEWGGICGSDLSYWRHGASGTAVLGAPLVLGHEIAGRISALGPGVTGVSIGQPVTVHPAELVGDGEMPERLAGRTNLYPAVRYFGSAAFTPHTDGGFSQRKTVRASQLRPLPDGVSTLYGALAEPLAVAMHAVKRAGDLSGRDILVNGAGPIGCLVVAAAKHAGARSVTATDLSDTSLSIAAAMGADMVLNVADPSNMPADAEMVFEASGAPAALGNVLRATARGGTLVQVGNLPGTPAPALLGDLVTREITWIGSYRFVEEITDALEAMAGGLDVSPVITHRFALDDADHAMRVAADRTSGSSKVMLDLGSAASTSSTGSDERPSS